MIWIVLTRATDDKRLAYLTVKSMHGIVDSAPTEQGKSTIYFGPGGMSIDVEESASEVFEAIEKATGVQLAKLREHLPAIEVAVEKDGTIRKVTPEESERVFGAHGVEPGEPGSEQDPEPEDPEPAQTRLEIRPARSCNNCSSDITDETYERNSGYCDQCVPF